MSEAKFPEAAGLQDQNVTYNYAMASDNNLKEICIALKALRAKKGVTAELPENPGYSVTLDILNCLKDIAVADGATLTPKAYANDIEGIADVIRAMASVESNDEELDDDTE